MDVKYQIALLGPGAGGIGLRVRHAILKRLNELDPKLSDHVRFLRASDVRKYDPKSPSVGIYMGGKNHPAGDLRLLRQMIDSAAAVVPVVKDLSRFQKSVPKELFPINGFETQGSNFDAISNIALENLGLLRKDRRIFISYRRADSASVALQLRHALEAKGYDAFLDTHSVPAADPFQEVLWQRLLDSDLVVLLDTPEFLESRWTREELAKTQALTIGILQLIWPEHDPARHTELCSRLYLKGNDFKGGLKAARTKDGRLKDDTLDKVAAAVESLRARCLAARHNNLVREFCDAAGGLGASTAIQPARYVLARLKIGRMIAAIPAVGVPDAFRYYDANIRFSGKNTGASAALLLYDHRGLRASWSEFLNWLHKYLPVKAIRITDVAAELKKIR